MAPCCSSKSKSTLHGFTVTYNSESHFRVLCQCWGSVWPRVLPYCLFNVFTSVVLQFFQGRNGFDFRVTDKGHSYVTMLVAFLVVSRATVSLARYNQVRAHLTSIYCNTRQFVEQVAVFSSLNANQSGQQWRHDVTYLALLELRAVMAVIDYQSDGIPAWEHPEFDEKTMTYLKKQLFLGKETLQFAHHTRYSENEENMRVPIRMALRLRETVVAQRTMLDKSFSGAEERTLLGSVDKIMAAYYGIRAFLTTPFPFPLVQMSRTFLFFYLFTVPFALLSDVSQPVAHCVVVFFLTYGFMGMEYVAIELDDPFGSDANDFDNGRMAEVSYEDTYTTIADIDGTVWTDKLRKKMDAGKYAGDIPQEAAEWLHRSGEV